MCNAVDTQSVVRTEGAEALPLSILTHGELYQSQWWERNSGGHVWERDARNQVVIHPASQASHGHEKVHCTVCGEAFCVLCIVALGQFATEHDGHWMEYAGPDKVPCRGYYLPAQ